MACHTPPLDKVKTPSVLSLNSTIYGWNGTACGWVMACDGSLLVEQWDFLNCGCRWNVTGHY